jgi:3-hydroxy-9,10-secoandrosta-1,3,5(10)-triene-9,17-dione monooxygenase
MSLAQLAVQPRRGEDVLGRVNALVDALRARAPETERLRHMHPDNLRDLTAAGVFRLAMPADVGGYQADGRIIAEVLAQISRGCPSTGWMSTLMVVSGMLPAFLPTGAADEIYSTPDLRVSAALAPTGRAVPVEGGYRVSGLWTWNTAGVHTNWFAAGCLVATDAEPQPLVVLIPVTEVTQQDNWRAAGLAGSATNNAIVDDVYVPIERTMPMGALTEGDYHPSRRYSQTPYFNRPFVMFIHTVSGGVLVGMARGAMDSFMATLPTRGAIAYTAWQKPDEAPIVHHQLAKAQYGLDGAEMFLARSLETFGETLHRRPTTMERTRARAYIGQIATLSRGCVNQLFEASSASQTVLTADIQRYFRDINVLCQHGAIQPNTGDEQYGRVLAGLEPNSELL